LLNRRAAERQQDAYQGFQDTETSFVATVLQLVPSTSWRFGRMRGHGDLLSFSCARADDEQTEIEHFRTCCRSLPRRGVTIANVSDPQHPHAVAIAFPGPVAELAILVLLRDEALGPFRRDELELLALAVELGEEMLTVGSPFAHPSHAQPVHKRRSARMVVILDRLYRIVLVGGVQPGSASTVNGFRGLPEIVEQAVRGMTNAWRADPAVTVNAVTMLPPFLMVRAQSIEGAGGEPYLAVTIERVRRRNALRHASERYEITPREERVLAHLLSGMRIDEIGARLNIATSTVNDHVKSLIARTGSSNRSQMLARILGWDGADPGG
jgi:DNA-binding CsgD family transcriptional regulator